MALYEIETDSGLLEIEHDGDPNDLAPAVSGWVESQRPLIANELPHPETGTMVIGSDPPEPVTSDPIADAIRRVPSGLAQTGAMAVGALQTAASLVAGPGRIKERIQEQREVTRSVQERAPEDYGVDPLRDEDGASKVIAGATNLVGTMAGGPLAPLVGGALMGESSRQDAEAFGATEAQQAATFGIAGATGVVSEFLLGIPALLRSAKATGASDAVVRSTARKLVEQGFTQAGRGATDEVIEQWVNNLTASTAVGYDPSRKATAGLGEAAMLGAAVGGPAGVVVQGAVEADTSRATAKLDAAVEAEAQALIGEAATPVAEPVATTDPNSQPQPEPTTPPQPDTRPDEATTAPQAEPDAVAEPLPPEVASSPSPVIGGSPEAAAVADPLSSTTAETPEPAATLPGTQKIGDVKGSAAPVNAEQSPSGIRNAIVDKERVERGLPERMEPLRRTFGTIWDEAMGRADKDPQAGTKLVKSIEDNPRPLEDWESALLAHEQVTRQNAFDQAVEEVNAKPGDAEAAARLEAARDDVQSIYDAGQKAGTKSGQSLAARKLLVNEDFTLSKMEAVTRATVNGGQPLSAAQAAEVKALHEKIATTEKKLAEYEAEEQARTAKDAFDNLIREQKKEATASARQGKSLTDFLDEAATKARARIVARRGRLNVTIDPLNVAGLVDEAIIGASYFAKGVREISAWSKKMVADFGTRIEPYLNDLFERSKGYHDDNAKLFAKKEGAKASRPKADKGILDPQSVFDLAREKVNSGMTDLDAVMLAVHADLVKQQPGLTVREVRDAFSGYGKVKFPSKEADLATLRELKRQGQLASAIEDAIRKIAPMKSGPQRDAASQRVREMQKELKEAMRTSGIETTSPEQQLKSANEARKTALKNQIEDLDKRLKTGQKPVGKTPVPDSPEVEKLRAERDAMKAKMAEIDAEENPGLTPEQRQLKADKKAIANRTAKLKAKIAAGDYTKPAKKTPLMDDEKTKLLFENAKAKEAYARGLFEARLKQRTTKEKIFGGIGEALNTARALMTSLDLSATLRQGNFITLAHPVRAAKSIGPMLRAFASEKAAFKVDADIAARPNAQLYKQAKLELTEQGATSLSKMEEAYMGRIASKIPIVAGSARAYSTFLNKLRADSFDAMAASLSRTKAPTIEEAKAIANFINVATGRGNLGKFQQAGVLLNTTFFAPRYVASRFQLLAGQPLYGGTARTRALVATEYGRYLAGAGLVMALAIAAQDDDDPPIVFDPKSTDFLKVRFGNTRLDLFGGLLQATVFTFREADALRRTLMQSTEATPKYGTGGDVAWRFLRSKLSPAVGAGVNLADGKNVVGQKATPLDTAISLVTPMQVMTIKEVMENQGMSKGAALTVLSVFGSGVQTYDEKKKK